MTVEKAREILGKRADNITDKELERIIQELAALADVFIKQQERFLENG